MDMLQQQRVIGVVVFISTLWQFQHLPGWVSAVFFHLVL
ncbi:hypothetical protein SC1083_0017 [Aggregatibacter actinomycetemcomitans serotype e str. SC1083]|uniref:Uncharacterized protein n=1 Tax=Aggregatibacter actinomycetemcomitans serotype e str. SC1083 TaxID=907488 RepID=G4A5D2_AGGAC|nr:hypothetical protein SC1083_0017 [Aggregatibacter actinomycetemcomitans serotype e str. SC1083]KYK75587.1 hypothetical protein SA3096_02905 [Aggregatibacter actinomycetemcomitans serotype e str. SA3096]KYK79288.1 hypothetical protein SC936_07915 [Aggregatibacter actinomycetemcomitans serotype e str. SC936]KYK94915.1 hypothetical protein ANH9776_05955 [Aggregatibacter actinomycetemcomitans serotype e str. ANH9776]